MKIITLNLRHTAKVAGIGLRLMAFFMLLVFCVRVSSVAFENSALGTVAAVSLAEKNTIIIDAGHGGEDCGAIGASGVYEKDLNLEVALIVGELLTDQGYTVVYTRTEDKLLYTDAENIKGIRKISDLKNRCKIGAEYADSLFVSIHMNSYSDAKYSGLHVYYSPKAQGSERLAHIIQNRVREDVQPMNNRVPKLGKNMYLLENLENTAVLIECGFLTNVQECEKLSQKEYQKQLSFSIVCGIIEYMNTVES